MIHIQDYFRGKENSPEVTPAIRNSAMLFLSKVRKLLANASMEATYDYPRDPDTGTIISGSRGGSGDGGFRLSSSRTGALLSAHKLGRAVDIYDPLNILDEWITTRTLEFYNLYREHPNYTPGWCHLQDLPPRSGNRTFIP